MDVSSHSPSDSTVRRFIQPLASFLEHIPAAWRYSLIAFFTGRIFFSLWGVLIWKMGLYPKEKGEFYFNIDPILDGLPGAFIGMWQRWDSIHYQRIVMFGYEDTPLTAYFPLYPMLGKAVSLLGVHPVAALIVVSNLALVLGMVFLYKVVEARFSPEMARTALFSLMIYPSAFFLYAVYPQSLLLLWGVLAYWTASRGRWASAAAVGILAGLTHPTSAAISLLIGWEALLSIREKKPGSIWMRLTASASTLIGVGLFMGWRMATGFKSYTENLHGQWGRGMKMPWEVVAEIWRYMLSVFGDPAQVIGWLYLVLFFTVLYLTIRAIGKIPLSMWLFQAGLLSITMTMSVDGDPLLGITRYPVAVFPLFIEIAMFGSSKPLRLLKFFFYVTLSLVCVSLFFMWKAGVF